MDAGGQDYEEEEIRTPIKPSAKALGKRRVVEMEEADRKSYTVVTLRLDILTLFQRTHSTQMTFSMNGQMPVR